MPKESFFSVKDIFRDRRKLTVFGVCVGLALMMWLLTSLGKDYNTTFFVPVKYSNFPENKTLLNEISDRVAVNVSGSGYDLLKYDGRLENDTLVINLNNLKISVIGGYQRGTLDPAIISKDLQERLNGMLAINSVLTDSLEFVFDLKVTRIVPVQPMVEFNVPKGYVLLDSVMSTPNEVEIIGALSVLDTLSSIKTDTLRLGELSKATTKTIMLSRAVVGQDAVLSHDSVQLTVNIDQLTEKSFLLEPQKLNVPDSINLLLFPSSVEVIMQVPISRYDDILERDIQLNVDFQDYNPEYPTLPLNLVSWPVQAKNVKLKDQQVEVVLSRNQE